MGMKNGRSRFFVLHFGAGREKRATALFVLLFRCGEGSPAGIETPPSASTLLMPFHFLSHLTTPSTSKASSHFWLSPATPFSRPIHPRSHTPSVPHLITPFASPLTATHARPATAPSHLPPRAPRQGEVRPLSLIPFTITRRTSNTPHTSHLAAHSPLLSRPFTATHARRSPPSGRSASSFPHSIHHPPPHIQRPSHLPPRRALPVSAKRSPHLIAPLCFSTPSPQPTPAPQPPPSHLPPCSPPSARSAPSFPHPIHISRPPPSPPIAPLRFPSPSNKTCARPLQRLCRRDKISGHLMRKGRRLYGESFYLRRPADRPHAAS